MDQPHPVPADHGGRPRVSLVLRYASAADVWRDRLPDLPRGLLARTVERLSRGDVVQLQLDIRREGAKVFARGRVAWVSPLAKASLIGLELEGVTHRDDVQIDLMLGLRGQPPTDDPACAPGEGPLVTPIPVAPQRRLDVAMLQPNGVLRGVIAGALARWARERSRWDLRVHAVPDTAQFLSSVTARRPRLGIVDCDAISRAADPLLDAVRSSDEVGRTPLILLSELRSARLEDRYTVTMRKPVAMKALLHTVDLFLRD